MKSILLIVGIFTCITAIAQYKYDNVLFKTIQPSELIRTLQANKGALILDVRSRGEHHDTSSFGSNYGRFRNAVNIDIRELGKRISEIADHKDKPVFVYCSHSQRSRRASKMLADSGFTKVFNINGGMTAFHYMDVLDDDDVRAAWETGMPFNYISPYELSAILRAKPTPPYILDVRPDSAFRHISADPKLNALGTITRNNIPLKELEASLEKLPKNGKIIVVDAFGNDAAKAGVLLKQKGFKDVAVLLEGMDRWTLSDEAAMNAGAVYHSPVRYKIISAYELGRWQESGKQFTPVDIRSTQEFTNQHTEAFRNIGNIKNAVNVPLAEISNMPANIAKNAVIVLYEFGGGSNAHAAARSLTEQGFTNVHVLAGGLFNLRWTAANMNKTKLLELVEKVPEINW